MATISKSRALSIIANPSCARVCRVLALLHEEFQSVSRLASRGAGCSGCDTSGPEFEPLRTKAIEALATMSDEDIAKVKAFIQEPSVTFYTGTGKSISRITR